MTPGLRKAKAAAQRTICLSNLRQLTAVWVTYATENNGVIAESATCPVQQVASGGISVGGYNFNWNFTGSVFGTLRPTWAGMYPAGGLSLGTIVEDTVHNAGRLAAVRIGTFYPYTQNDAIYLCPAAEKRQVRSYTTLDSLNGISEGWVTQWDPKWKPAQKLSEIRSHSLQMVFVCEDDSLGGHGWSIWPSLTTEPHGAWFDYIPTLHSGVASSYADGSAQYWRYEDDRTLSYVQAKRRDPYSAASAGPRPVMTPTPNEDFLRLRRGAWGQIAR